MNPKNISDNNTCPGGQLIEDGVENLQFGTIESIIYPIIPVVMLTGILMNAAFLYMLWRLKRLHTTFNLFLANMVIADLISLAIPLPRYFVFYLKSREVYSVPFDTNTSYLCYFINYVESFTELVSLGMITWIAKERYLAICKPSLFKGVMASKRNVSIVCLCVWIVALLLGAVTALPQGISVKFCLRWPAEERYEQFPKFIHRCDSRKLRGVDADVFVIYPIAIYFFIFTFCLLVNILAYGNIVYALQKARKTRRRLNNDDRQLRNIIVTLVVSGIVTFLIHIIDMVALVLDLLLAINDEDIVTNRSQIAFILLCHAIVWLHSIIRNIYFFVSPYFKDSFKEVFSHVVYKVRLCTCLASTLDEL